VWGVLWWRMRRFWPKGMQYKNPFYFGWFVSSWIITLAAYALFIVNETSNMTLSSISFVLANALFGYFLFTSARADPGFLPHSGNLVTELSEMLDRGENPRLMCARCISWSTVRAKHCYACDRCVAQWDHHCVWVNNCVGALNHREFYLMLVSMLVSQFLFLRLDFIVLHRLSLTVDAPSLFAVVSVTIERAPLLASLFIFQGMMFLWGWLLMYWQTKGIVSALTTAELAHGGSYGYLRSGNPFSRGSRLKNLLAFFTNTIDWRTVWHVDRQPRESAV